MRLVIMIVIALNFQSAKAETDNKTQKANSFKISIIHQDHPDGSLELFPRKCDISRSEIALLLDDKKTILAPHYLVYSATSGFSRLILDGREIKFKSFLCKQRQTNPYCIIQIEDDTRKQIEKSPSYSKDAILIPTGNSESMGFKSLIGDKGVVKQTTIFDESPNIYDVIEAKGSEQFLSINGVSYAIRLGAQSVYLPISYNKDDLASLESSKSDLYLAVKLMENLNAIKEIGDRTKVEDPKYTTPITFKQPEGELRILYEQSYFTCQKIDEYSGECTDRFGHWYKFKIKKYSTEEEVISLREKRVSELKDQSKDKKQCVEQIFQSDMNRETRIHFSSLRSINRNNLGIQQTKFLATSRENRFSVEFESSTLAPISSIILYNVMASVTVSIVF